MTSDALTSQHGALTINWRAMGTRADRDTTLLAVAEAEGLLEHRSTRPDNHYGVLCNGQHLLLTSEEVPGFVLGVLVAAGKSPELVPYRLGIKPL